MKVSPRRLSYLACAAVLLVIYLSSVEKSNLQNKLDELDATIERSADDFSPKVQPVEKEGKISDGSSGKDEEDEREQEEEDVDKIDKKNRKKNLGRNKKRSHQLASNETYKK